MINHSWSMRFCKPSVWGVLLFIAFLYASTGADQPFTSSPSHFLFKGEIILTPTIDIKRELAEARPFTIEFECEKMDCQWRIRVFDPDSKTVLSEVTYDGETLVDLGPFKGLHGDQEFTQLKRIFNFPVPFNSEFIHALWMAFGSECVFMAGRKDSAPLYSKALFGSDLEFQLGADDFPFLKTLTYKCGDSFPESGRKGSTVSYEVLSIWELDGLSAPREFRMTYTGSATPEELFRYDGHVREVKLSSGKAAIGHSVEHEMALVHDFRFVTGFPPVDFPHFRYVSARHTSESEVARMPGFDNYRQNLLNSERIRRRLFYIVVIASALLAPLFLLIKDHLRQRRLRIPR